MDPNATTLTPRQQMVLDTWIAVSRAIAAEYFATGQPDRAIAYGLAITLLVKEILPPPARAHYEATMSATRGDENQLFRELRRDFPRDDHPMFWDMMDSIDRARGAYADDPEDPSV